MAAMQPEAAVRVADVARGEDAFDVGYRRARFDLDVAFGVELQLVAEQLRVGMVSDGQEEARDVDLHLLAVVAAQQCARHARLVAQYLGGVVVEYHLDVGGAEHALLHRLRGAQVGFAHDHVDLAADRGEVGGLLAGGVAAADHGHVLFTVEEAVAGGAGTHAHAAEFRLRGEPQVSGRGARGNDQAFGPDLLLAVDHHVERPRREVYAGGCARADLGAEALGLTPHVGHHLLAADPVGVAREILHVGRRRELPARFDALVEHGLEVCTRRIDGGRVSCGAAADNQAFDRFFHDL